MSPATASLALALADALDADVVAAGGGDRVVRAGGDPHHVRHLPGPRAADIAAEGDRPAAGHLAEAGQGVDQAVAQDAVADVLGVAGELPEHEAAVEERGDGLGARVGFDAASQRPRLHGGAQQADQRFVDGLVLHPGGVGPDHIARLAEQHRLAEELRVGVRAVAQPDAAHVDEVALRRLVAVEVDLRAVGGEDGVVGGDGRRGNRLGEAREKAAGRPRDNPGHAAARRTGGLDTVQELGLVEAR